MLADPRHMGIALVSGITIMFGGAIAFAGSSEAAVQAFAVVGFVTVFAIFHFLDERAQRRKKDRAQ